MKKYSRRAALALSWLALTVSLLGCPQSQDGVKEPLLTFSAAGEVRPFFQGAPVFGEEGGAPVYRDLAPLLTARDLALVDFAGSLDLGCQPLLRDEVLRWSPAWLDDLAAANLRVLDLADDHSLDCGRESLKKTIDQLTARGFYLTGAGRTQKEAAAPVYLTQGGITISLVSFLLEAPPGIDPCADCTGPAMYDKQTMISALQEMKKRAAFRIVILHFPERDLPGLSPPELAMVRETMDFGADLVIGQGARSAGGLYRVRGKWAVASLGTFTGDAGKDPQRIVDGLLLSAEFSQSRIMNLRLAPLAVEQGAPRLVRGEAARTILEGLIQDTAPEVRTNIKIVEDIIYLK